MCMVLCLNSYGCMYYNLSIISPFLQQPPTAFQQITVKQLQLTAAQELYAAQLWTILVLLKSGAAQYRTNVDHTTLDLEHFCA